jgi:hypothetical protein
MKGFSLTSDYVSVTRSGWNLVANICAIVFSFSLIDELAMLDENPFH